MTTQTDAKKRGTVLKQLRELHKDDVERTRALLKEQQVTRKQIGLALHDGPKSIPDVAQATGFPAHLVLWHVTAMKKYDLVKEVGMSGEYYLYQQTEEAK